MSITLGEANRVIEGATRKAADLEIKLSIASGR